MFTRIKGGAALVRAPRSGKAPCSQLRESERWSVAAGPIVYPLPPGNSATVASIIFAPNSLLGEARRVNISVDQRSYVGWVRAPATGAMEVPVPPKARHLTVEAPPGTWVRARVRRHRSPPAPAPAPTPTPRAEQQPPEERIASLTKKLEVTPSKKARDQLLGKRASLLKQTGFSRFSRRDSELRSEQAPPLSLPTTQTSPDAILLNDKRLAVPLGLLSRTPLLGSTHRISDTASEEWERALSLAGSGRETVALSVIEHRGLWHKVNYDALLKARIHENLGQLEPAAEIYARLGQATSSGALLKKAAEAALDASRLGASAEEANRAFIWSEMARQQGEETNLQRSILAPGLAWARVPPTTLGRGRARVEVTQFPMDSLTKFERMRRVLSQAPEDARIFSKFTKYQVGGKRHKRLRIEYGCLSASGPTERCEVKVELGSERLQCVLGRPQPKGKSTTSKPLDTSLFQHCEVKAPRSLTPLRFRVLEDGKTTAWAKVTTITDQKQTVMPLTFSFGELTPEDSINLRLRGPTVVRLALRNAHVGKQELHWSLRETNNSSKPKLTHGSIALSAQHDPNARWREADQRLGHLVERSLVLDKPVNYVLTATPRDGTVLARVSFSRVEHAPTPKPLTIVKQPITALPVHQKWPGFRVVDLASARPPRALTYTASAALVDRDVSDEDQNVRDRVARLRLAVRTRAWPGVWLRGEVFGRLRAGADSAGVDARVSTASGSAWPAISWHGRLLFQGLKGRRYLSGRSSLSASYPLKLTQAWTLSPSLDWSFRHAFEPEKVEEFDGSRPLGADPELFSSFGASRPTALGVGVVARQELFVDTFSRYSLNARLGPRYDALDQLSVVSEWQALPGSSWFPRVRLRLGASLRPSYSERPDGFMRVSAGVTTEAWHWLRERERVRLLLHLLGTGDLGRANDDRNGRLFLRLQLAFDALSDTHVRDFSPRARPFPQRLEEGAPRILRKRGSGDPLWESLNE